jgi:membrane-bound lytic murein transglycosylase D
MFGKTLLSLSLLIAISPVFASGAPEGIKQYQHNVHTDPEHKRKLAADISRYRNADNLWDVLRDEFSLSHYENNPLVQEKIDWYMNNQDFLLRSVSRAAPYLYYILQQVKKRHLPAELVLLPIIESGYNPFAQSNMGAVGIWQLMPSTATGLWVRRDVWYDGRRDVIASTRAALDYLAYLQSFFDGNWLLAIAAYNTGEGNVSSAIRKNIRNGRNTDFWSLPVAQQTKDYVPSLLALAVIITHPDQYPIYFPPVRNAAYLAQIDTDKQISLKSASVLAGIDYKKLISLNPGFSKPGFSETKHRYKLVLPIENVEKFSENLALNFPTSKPIDWIHYRVKTGDTLASISRSHKTTVTALRKMNHLPKALAKLKRGTTILIPNMQMMAENEVETPEPVSEVSSTRALAKKAAVATRKVFTNSPNKTYLVQPGDTVYIVRDTDTLTDIAHRFNVSNEMIMATNSLSSHRVKSGDQLVIPTGHSTKNSPDAVELDNDMQPGDTLYMVRKGDTIDKIAKQFKVSPSVIKLANFVDDRTLFEGEKLIVPTHKSG